MAGPIAVTAETFEAEVLGSGSPVLVDFWAAWCGPCRQVAPTMERIAEEYEGSVKVVNVDVDAEGELAGRFGISSIPTIAFFEPGEQPKAMVGAVPKESTGSARTVVAGRGLSLRRLACSVATRKSEYAVWALVGGKGSGTA